MTRKFALSFTTAIALSLSACGGSGGDGATSGDTVEAVKAPEGKNWVDTVEVTEEGGYLIGNPDAKIKLIEYGSLTCPACAAFTEQSSEELKKDYINTGKVSFEFRNFIRESVDLTATRIIRCAPKDSFLALTDQFMAAQREILTRGQSIDRATLEAIDKMPSLEQPVALSEAFGMTEFFAQRGISRDQVKSCLSDQKEMQALADMVEGYSKKYDIAGTPTFFLNGNRLNANGWIPVKKALQDAGAR